MLPSGIRQVIEPRLTIEPLPIDFMVGMMDWDRKNMWRRLAFMLKSQDSDVMLLVSRRAMDPVAAALFIRIWIGPWVERIEVVVSWSVGRSVRSQW